MKLNKKESVIVDSFDWNVEVILPTEDYSDIDDILIEAATMAVEGRFHSNPNDFKIGAVVKVMFKKSDQFIKYINSYQVLCNASLYKQAEDIRRNYLKISKIDLMTEPLVTTE